MGRSMEESRLAVDCGYWPLYRYNPALADEGKNPLILESKAPDGSFQEFLSGENRYAALERTIPEEASRMRAELEKDYMRRYLLLKQMADAPPIVVSDVGGKK
jgi:pyruvate-ferredoxin/flavodoxin oxidoreductase